MRRRALAGLAPLLLAGAALAQAPDPHAGHVMAPEPADPHAGHVMAPAAPADRTPPGDHAADRIYPPERMAAARAQLAREHGDQPWRKFMLETAELRPSGGGYAWEGRASFGGDLHRFVLQSEGEGDEGLHRAELQALYVRAVSPYFDLQAGLRQDVEPRPRRAYATVGFAGVAPYGFELEGALFLSDRGEASARLEAAQTLRLTQRLILEPRAELNLSAQKVRALGLGAGLTDAELGLRLRYAVRPEFAPYVGVEHARRFGAAARFARTAGEKPRDTRLVIGLRAWF